jgi:hypothetical protein
MQTAATNESPVRNKDTHCSQYTWDQACPVEGHTSVAPSVRTILNF